MMKKLTLSLIVMTSLMLMMVGVQAMHFLGMNGSSLSVTSESGSYPEETVLDDVAFDAQSGLVTIEGTISDLNVALGPWPDTAYLEIGIRPEATKEETNAGVYMIVLGSSNPELLVFHMQDYGGHRPGGYGSESICVYVDAEKAEEGIDYRITLTGGTAYFEIWDANGTYYDGGMEPVEYGYSDASTFDEDFSEARLFYSLMADGSGVPDITYSATIGDITTNILLPHPEVWVDDDYYDGGYNDGHVWDIESFATIQEGINVVDEGGTVNVGAGTYDENIVIGKSLIVRGANAGIAATETRGSESIIDAQLADMGVLINGAETVATFDGFTVENYEVIGILAGAFSPTWGDDPVEVHILNNIVDAPSPLVDAHNNNIQVGDGTTGTVIGNEVSGANLESPDWTGSGILVAGSSDVLVSENYVHNCESGIVIVGYAEYRDAPAINNFIEDNLVEDSGTGISVQMYSLDTIIRYNDVLNNDGGIAVMAIDYSWEHSTPSGTEIHYNNIIGNVNYGVKSGLWGSNTGNVPAEQVDATENWWGHASGPSGLNGRVNPDGKEVGKGDAVIGNVDWDPWLPQLIGLTPNKPVPPGLR